MKALWAPWRMEYILASKGKLCFLCEAGFSNNSIASDKRHLVLKRGRWVFLIMNRYPYNNGHLMVAPYRHIATLDKMNDDEMLEMMQMASLACKKLKGIMRCDGFNVGFNLGKVAGAGLKEHIHLHIVPRWAGDTNFMPVISDTKIIPQALESLWQQLYEHLK